MNKPSRAIKAAQLYFFGTPQTPLFKLRYFWFFTLLPLIPPILWVISGEWNNPFCLLERACYLYLEKELPTPWKWFIGLSGAIAALVASHHRSAMTAHQIKSSAYTEHKDSFVEYLNTEIQPDLFTSETLQSKFNPYYISKSVFPYPSVDLDPNILSSIARSLTCACESFEAISKDIFAPRDWATGYHEGKEKLNTYFIKYSNDLLAMHTIFFDSPMPHIEHKKFIEVAKIFEDHVGILQKIVWYEGSNLEMQPVIDRLLKINQQMGDKGYAEVRISQLGDRIMKDKSKKQSPTETAQKPIKATAPHSTGSKGNLPRPGDKYLPL